MRDNEIIKALECCSHSIGNLQCEHSPAYSIAQMCIEDLMSAALDLINRQMVEIEKWKKKANTQFAKVTFDENKLKEIVDECVKNIEININLAKSEAIKEFADGFKTKATVVHKTYSGKRWYEINDYDIDDLVKEMTEENENDR